ncbi:hypothetical protein [Methylomonas albis]|uniref:PEP-CTERM protein-sorting domain-containing protein n=1 Tax=Methylomonas albis TaxID=1854563 RepID=A0ABR9D6C1_9GAMM|nr:hypothetical protein [Methylomonas albis]MBD9358638.1 hypothetical protein [Methylomonas albis]
MKKIITFLFFFLGVITFPSHASLVKGILEESKSFLVPDYFYPPELNSGGGWPGQQATIYSGASLIESKSYVNVEYDDAFFFIALEESYHIEVVNLNFYNYEFQGTFDPDVGPTGQWVFLGNSTQEQSFQVGYRKQYLDEIVLPLPSSLALYTSVLLGSSIWRISSQRKVNLAGVGPISEA